MQFILKKVYIKKIRNGLRKDYKYKFLQKDVVRGLSCLAFVNLDLK